MLNIAAGKNTMIKTAAKSRLRAVVMMLSAVCTMFALEMQPAAAVSTASGNPWMQTTTRTSQPVGHYDFCKLNRKECSQISRKDTPLSLDQNVWNKIIRINAHVNQIIKPRTDMQIWGQEEVWSYPVNYGDCEDYALLKRRMLIEAGVPVNALLMTVVRQPNGEGHAVLTMRTDRGDFILDNLAETVKIWTETDYTYIKRQSAYHSGQWVGINHQQDMLLSNVLTSTLNQ